MKLINKIKSCFSIEQEVHTETVNNSEELQSNSELKGSENIHAASSTADGTKESKDNGKARIYNLIIVDESGSMSGLRDITLSGINETLNSIREAQNQYKNVQEHFVSLVTFDERSDRNVPAVRSILDAVPVMSVNNFEDYHPCGCTPLYDALGDSLTSLRKKISNDENAVAIVTVFTDGLENASRHWRVDALHKLIEQLKEEGWIFSYMGSAHNVKEVTDLLSIDNVVEFSHDMTGAQNTWGRERSSKRAFFSKMANEFVAEESIEEKRERRRRYNKEYYGARVTPDNIRSLEPNEIFVFGSNSEGHHGGGAAMTAMRFFGAEWGNGEGIQGQSYAIPTMEGLEHLSEAVHRFCIYAREHQNLKFFVTRIGCGIAGYSPVQIAPMFKEAIELENVALPSDFWEVMGLRMY